MTDFDVAATVLNGDAFGSVLLGGTLEHRISALEWLIDRDELPFMLVHLRAGLRTSIGNDIVRQSFDEKSETI